MPEFPLILSLSLLGSLKRKRIFMAFSLSLSSFFQMPKQSLILYRKTKKKKKQTQKRQQEIAQLVVPVCSIFKTFSTRISLPISMIFTSPLPRFLSLLGFHFSAFPRHFCELCGLIYQKSIRVHRLLLHVVLMC